MTITVDPRNIFRHDELPNFKSSFRLLRIISAPHVEAAPQEEQTGSKLVECELTEWLTADAPPYRAVSYTWGDPKSTTWIQVNGKHFQVRQNCEYVLRQAYRHSGPRVYIWIDAICINQVDNFEKNHQVSNMGNIFKYAERVLACVGAHDTYSQFLIHTLVRRSKLFLQASIRESLLYKSYSQSDRAFNLALILWRFRSSEPQRLVRAFLELSCRPYFQRVWTLPELWLARGVDLLCGEDHVLAQTLYGLVTIINNDLIPYSSISEPWNRDIPLLRRTINLAVEASCLSNHVPRLRGISTRPKHMHALSPKRIDRQGLFMALRLSQSLQCDDIRDRVYALISIVDWGPLKTIQPDYDRDVYDLMLSILQLSIPQLANMKKAMKWATQTHKINGRFEDTICHKRISADDIQVLELIDCLQIGVQTNPKLAQAIHDRRHDIKDRPAGGTAREKLPPNGRYTFIYRGIQLLVDNGAWKLDLLRHKHQGLSSVCLLKTVYGNEERWETIKALQQPHHVVISDKKQPQALLPPCVQPGDWIVGNQEFGLIILRKRADGRYNIVGEARAPWPIYSCMEEIGKLFTVFFDPEDLLVLALGKDRKSEAFLKASDFSSDVDLQLIVRSLENAVCSAEGSSYAEMVH
ncbi:hypothetical protein HD806DRAFT_514862 [Xylariaceae sp. AK1471]|nr:hypothetical protein HD806DRAFT_514862 [Xylariaceae sp. AK1471]